MKGCRKRSFVWGIALIFLTSGCLEVEKVMEKYFGDDPSTEVATEGSETTDSTNGTVKRGGEDDSVLSDVTADSDATEMEEEIDTDEVNRIVFSLLEAQGTFFDGIESLFSNQRGGRVSILNPRKSTQREREARLKPLFQGQCPEVVDRSESLAEDPLFLQLQWGRPLDEESWETCTTRRGLELSGEMTLVLEVANRRLDVTTDSLSFVDSQTTIDGSTTLTLESGAGLIGLDYQDTYVISYPKILHRNEEGEDALATADIETEGRLGFGLGSGFSLQGTSSVISSELGYLDWETDIAIDLRECIFPLAGSLIEVHYQLDEGGIVSVDISFTFEETCGEVTVQVGDGEPETFNIFELIDSLTEEDSA